MFSPPASARPHRKARREQRRAVPSTTSASRTRDRTGKRCLYGSRRRRSRGSPEAPRGPTVCLTAPLAHHRAHRLGLGRGAEDIGPPAIAGPRQLAQLAKLDVPRKIYTHITTPPILRSGAPERIGSSAPVSMSRGWPEIACDSRTKHQLSHALVPRPAQAEGSARFTTSPFPRALHGGRSASVDPGWVLTAYYSPGAINDALILSKARLRVSPQWTAHPRPYGARRARAAPLWLNLAEGVALHPTRCAACATCCRAFASRATIRSWFAIVRCSRRCPRR